MAASLKTLFTCFYYTSFIRNMLHICLNSGKGYTIIHLKLREIYTIPEEKQKNWKNPVFYHLYY